MSTYSPTRLLTLLLLVSTMLLFQNCAKDTLTEEIAEPTTELQVTQDAATDFEQLTTDEPTATERTNDYYRFSTLNQALHCTGLTSALFSGEKTLFAPSDAAFAKLGLNAHNVCSTLDKDALTNILLYHVAGERLSLSDVGCVNVLNGDVAQLKQMNHRAFINESNIYARWRQTGHGYKLQVYAIKDVLMPPAATIVEAAIATDKFSSLVAAVTAADPAIAMALSNPDAVYTVFAPTNAAFDNLVKALGAKDLNDLVHTIGVDALSTVLLYHVVDGCAFSNDLSNGQHFTTLQGETIGIDLHRLAIKDKTNMPAPLVADCLDIRTSNGIVHTIDKVLLPQAILDALSGH